MKSAPSLLVACCAVIVAWLAPAQAAPFVQNGDFEDVQIISPFVSSNPADIPGWTHSGTVGDGLLWAVGYHDGGGSVTLAGHGNQFVTLGGGFGVPGSASWTTTVSGLTPGDLYTLSFDIANEGGDVGSPQTMIVFGNIGGIILDPVPYTAPAAGADYWRSWIPESESFVAFGTTASFTFQVGNQAFDMGLDNIAITAPVGVPEPASLVLMGAGLAGLGFLRLRSHPDPAALKRLRRGRRIWPLGAHAGQGTAISAEYEAN